MDHIRVCFTEHTLEGFIFNALGISSNIHELKERKSVGRSDTFKVTDEEKFWLSMLDKLTERVSEDLKELELVAKTVTLSYQTQNFEKRDKSQTLDNYTCEKQDLLDVVVKMLTKEVNYGTRLRLLGVRCTNLLNME
jgi:nucleotidyltransferase/DNA polymerase involved in DNA repair